MKSDIPGVLISMYRINFMFLPLVVCGSWLAGWLPGLGVVAPIGFAIHALLSVVLLCLAKARKVPQVVVLASVSLAAVPAVVIGAPAVMVCAVLLMVLYPMNVASLYESLMRGVRKKQILGCADHLDGTPAAYDAPVKIPMMEKVIASGLCTVLLLAMGFSALRRFGEALMAEEMQYQVRLSQQLNTQSTKKTPVTKATTDIEFIENPNHK